MSKSHPFHVQLEAVQSALGLSKAKQHSLATSRNAMMISLHRHAQSTTAEARQSGLPWQNWATTCEKHITSRAKNSLTSWRPQGEYRKERKEICVMYRAALDLM